MRAFLVLFLASLWALGAQEKPDFEKFKADFEVIKQEVANAKDRKISIDNDWIIASTQQLQKMLGMSQQLLSEDQPEGVKQAVMNMDIDSLIRHVRFVGQRFEADEGTQKWTIKELDKEFFSAKRVIEQLNNNGLQFEFQPMQVSSSLFKLEILMMVMQNKEFWARVCKDREDKEAEESCLTTGADLIKEVTNNYLKQALVWNEKAKFWKKPG